MNNIKPVPMDVAEKVLLDAGDTIRDRLKEHGHTQRSFQLIADLWTAYAKHAFTIRGRTELQAHDVAQMMALVKMARTVYGYSIDNFVDGAGYFALSAFLQRPAGPPEMPGPTNSLFDKKEETNDRSF